MKRAAIALASALMVVVACANGPESVGQPASGGVEDVATNLDVPWGIAFLPDGSALIAERNSGAIQRMAQPSVVNNVGTVVGVAARGEGGLLGLATSGQTVFAYFRRSSGRSAKRRHPGWQTSAAHCGWRVFAVSGSTGYRSAPKAHWPIRHRCLSETTGDYEPLSPHRMARCGSPPASATVGEPPRRRRSDHIVN